MIRGRKWRGGRRGEDVYVTGEDERNSSREKDSARRENEMRMVGVVSSQSAKLRKQTFGMLDEKKKKRGRRTIRTRDLYTRGEIRCMGRPSGTWFVRFR